MDGNMKKQYLYLTAFLFFISCSENEVEHFYVRSNQDKKVMKLSFDKGRTKELQEIYKCRNYSYLKNDTFSFNPFVGASSNFVIIGENKDGVQLDGMYSVLWNNQPFALEYIGLGKENIAEVKFISIEKFFTPQEKQQLRELIPAWRIFSPKK